MNLSSKEELLFQKWIRNTPWFSEFIKTYGEEPDLNDTTNYDYRGAWKAGVVPQIYNNPNEPQESGKYHWDSNFKGSKNPRLTIGGINTKTGNPIDTIALGGIGLYR